MAGRILGPTGEPAEEYLKRQEEFERRDSKKPFLNRLGDLWERRPRTSYKPFPQARKLRSQRLKGAKRGLETGSYIFVALLLDAAGWIGYFLLGGVGGAILSLIILILLFLVPVGRVFWIYAGFGKLFLFIAKILASFFFIPGLILIPILLISFIPKSSRKAVASQGYGAGYGPGGYGGGIKYKKKGYRERIGERVAEEGRVRVFWDLYGKPIFKFFFLILLIVGIYFGYKTAFFKDLQSSLGVKGGVQLENIGAVKFFTSIPGKISNYWNRYILGIGTFEPPEAETIAEVKGVDIENLHAVKQEFFEGEEIELLANAIVDAIDKDSVISFRCGIEESDGKIKSGTVTVVGKEEGENKANIPKNVNKKVPVICKIPSYDSVKEDFELKKGFLEWTYENFETRTALRVFTLSSEEKQRRGELAVLKLMREQGRNYIDLNGFSIPFCVVGCGLTSLTLKLNGENPLSENIEYYLDVALVGVIYGGRKGDMSRLELIRLQLPDGFSLGEGGCIGWERGDPEVFDAYDFGFDKLNQNLTLKKDNVYSYLCKIKVEQSAVGNELSPKTVIGSAIYDYGDKEFLTITMRKKTGSIGITTSQGVT